MTKELIRVSLPENIREDELPLFEPHLSYKLDKVKVRNMRDIFISNSGLCVNKKGLVKESHHTDNRVMEYFRNNAAFHYYDALDNPEKLIELNDDKVYLLIHNPYFNYYHWICEAIFRAHMVIKEKDDLVLLLPEYYSKSDFITGALAPLGFKNIFLIPDGKSLYVHKLCLPQIKPIVDSYDYSKMKVIKKMYLDYITAEKKEAFNFGDKIYISRKKAARKKVDNESAIESILLNYGFTILNNKDYSFLDQVAIYSNAKMLVSIHGSGLTNMLFMKEGSVVLEFHKKLTNDNDWHSLAFWYMAESLGYRYFHQICDPTDLNADYFNANFIVDAILLAENLNKMTGGTKS